MDFKVGKIYNTSNPFSWMESISIETKSNFFEQFSTNYQMADNVSSFSEPFSTDADF